VSTCTGIFGKGASAGYPGEILVDKTTGASYTAFGIDGRQYLLPATWDPTTSTSKFLCEQNFEVEIWSYACRYQGKKRLLYSFEGYNLIFGDV
jgi:hypothetical protein